MAMRSSPRYAPHRGKSRVRRFTVNTVAGVAEEMFRYDHCKVISKDGKYCDPRWTLPHLVKAYTVWEYVFEMVGEPAYPRWRSFGVKREDIQEVH